MDLKIKTDATDPENGLYSKEGEKKMIPHGDYKAGFRKILDKQETGENLFESPGDESQEKDKKLKAHSYLKTDTDAHEQKPQLQSNTQINSKLSKEPFVESLCVEGADNKMAPGKTPSPLPFSGPLANESPVKNEPFQDQKHMQKTAQFSDRGVIGQTTAQTAAKPQETKPFALHTQQTMYKNESAVSADKKLNDPIFNKLARPVLADSKKLSDSSAPKRPIRSALDPKSAHTTYLVDLENRPSTSKTPLSHTLSTPSDATKTINPQVSADSHISTFNQSHKVRTSYDERPIKDKKRSEVVTEKQEGVVWSPYATTIHAAVIQAAAAKSQDMADLVAQLVAQLSQLSQSGRTDTMLTLQHPPLFAGAQIVISEFDTAKGQFSISFYNLSDQASALVSDKANQALLRESFERSGLTMHFHQASQASVQDVNFAGGGQNDHFSQGEREGGAHDGDDTNQKRERNRR